MNRWRLPFASKRTTNDLGLPDVRLFFTDNPSGDKDFYPKMFPSLRAQLEKFDALCDGDAIAENTSDLPLYMSDRFKKVTLC